MDTDRLEAFSDAVFAVAITLLVLDLHVPSPGRALFWSLADEWPQFAAFAISFAIIGIIWVNHHGIFRRLSGVDRPLLFINLALLLAVVVIPFATALFAAYVAHSGIDADVAAALFSGALLLMAVCFAGMYQWVAHHDRLHAPGTAIERSLRSGVRFAAGLVAYAAGVGVAFVSPLAVLVISGAVAAYYVLDQVTER